MVLKANDDLGARCGSGRNIWKRIERAEFYSMTITGLFSVRSTERRCYWTSVCQVLKNILRKKEKIIMADNNWIENNYFSSGLPVCFHFCSEEERIRDWFWWIIKNRHPSWKLNTPFIEYWDTVAEWIDQVNRNNIGVRHQVTNRFTSERAWNKHVAVALCYTRGNSAGTPQALYWILFGTVWLRFLTPLQKSSLIRSAETTLRQLAKEMWIQ